MGIEYNVSEPSASIMILLNTMLLLDFTKSSLLPANRTSSLAPFLMSDLFMFNTFQKVIDVVCVFHTLEEL